MRLSIVGSATFLGLTCLAGVAHGQVIIQSQTYNQDFNSLAATGAGNSWQNNITIAGWYAYRTPSSGTVAVSTYLADNGSNSTVSLMSYGLVDSSDRALGSHTTLAGGTFRYGAGFTNGLANAITSASISFKGETWRINGLAAGAPIRNTIEFQFSLTASGIDDTTATWLDFDDLDFHEVSGTPNNGNISHMARSGTLSDLNLGIGSTLWVRWVDKDENGNDHALGIDDFQIDFTTSSGDGGGATTTPEPFTMALTGLGAVAVLRRKIKANQKPATS